MTSREQAVAYLHAEEQLCEISERKPHILHGTVMAACGVITLVDTTPLLLKSSQQIYLVVIVVLGALMAWSGLWILCLAQRSWVAVTNCRVLVQRINMIGHPSKYSEYRLSEINGCRMIKPLVTWKKSSYNGTVLIKLKNGKMRQLPYLENAQYILETIGSLLTTGNA